MIGARGCITYNAGSTISGIAGTGLYTVTVAWQSPENGFNPPTTIDTPGACGDGLYGGSAGSNQKRRLVSRVFRIANLI